MGKLSFDDRNEEHQGFFEKSTPFKGGLSDPAPLHCAINTTNESIRSAQCMGKLSFDDRYGFCAHLKEKTSKNLDFLENPQKGGQNHKTSGSFQKKARLFLEEKSRFSRFPGVPPGISSKMTKKLKMDPFLGVCFGSKSIRVFSEKAPPILIVFTSKKWILCKKRSKIVKIDPHFPYLGDGLSPSNFCKSTKLPLYIRI